MDILKFKEKMIEIIKNLVGKRINVYKADDLFTELSIKLNEKKSLVPSFFHSIIGEGMVLHHFGDETNYAKPIEWWKNQLEILKETKVNITKKTDITIVEMDFKVSKTVLVYKDKYKITYMLDFDGRNLRITTKIGGKVNSQTLAVTDEIVDKIINLFKF